MPLQVIDTTDSLTALMRFQTSAVYEMMISMHTLFQSVHHQDWVTQTRKTMPPGMWNEIVAVYEPYGKGALFFELAVDYANHDDVIGFTEYVRQMDPVSFIFYLVGRIISLDEINKTQLDYEALRHALEHLGFDYHCVCMDVPLDLIVADIPAFQNRLADVWRWYWDVILCPQIEELRDHWMRALAEKENILAQNGGEVLYEHITGHKQPPNPLPAEYPVSDITLVPLYLTPKSAYVFYGYGNVTALFDSERSEARAVEIARNKEQALEAFKALGDNSRLDILRLIARDE
ncbi:MAG TPA: hypothetical protein VHP83_16175, partial [Aggregatilineaceae bacterium]|nr:hypothetical protein [Aggregatilineaceae bacterium]